MSLPTPGTPSTSTRDDTSSIRASEINDFIKALSERFGLQLRIPRDGESPVSRRSALRDDDAKIGDEIVWLITFLSRRNYPALQGAVQAFQAEAETLRVRHGWVYKPNGDHDVIPLASNTIRDSSGRDGRLQLRECLLLILRGARKSKNVYSSDNVEPKSARLREVSLQTELDSTPIPLNLGPRPVKRTSGEFSAPDIATEFKKPRTPALFGSPELIKAGSIATISPRKEGAVQAVAPATNSTTPTHFLRSPLNTYHYQTSRTGSANTSFSSFASTVFTEKSVPGIGASSQETSFNTSFRSNLLPPRKLKAMEDDLSSSQHGSWNDDDDIEIFNEEGLQESSGVDVSMSDVSVGDDIAQGSLSQRLQHVFPELPQCLTDAPLCLRYEITRVFLHAEASMDGLQVRDTQKLLDYNTLWQFLKGLPQLQGKPFPEECAPKAWASSVAKWTDGKFEGVVMSASLKFSPSKSGPLFRIQLKPLTTDRTHRLGRRFGNDRFLEVTFPNLTNFQPRGKTDDLEMGRKEIIDWIRGHGHELMGIEWHAFGLKDARSKKIINNIELKKASDDAESKATHQVFFFAVDGIGFQTSQTPPVVGEDLRHHTRFDVKGLLRWLIPFHLESNGRQPYLKLFSRISLGLSKTYATVKLSAAEINFVRNDFHSNGKVMNDGCGQISRKLAHNIAQSLNLDYTPSAFQARIGGAKGMWIVDVGDFGDKTYIKIYPSQVKWDNKSFFIDPCHQMFEVLRWSGPVRSAALNLQFLPILEDRGRNNGRGMREALSRMLENGLTYEIGRQRAAMDSPQSFRNWVRETDSGITDRIKLGQVAYWAGLPKSRGEKLNLLLDSGFNPKELHFLRDLAWKANVDKCDLLKSKLNISVGRSAYLPMVVDFKGILGPREVHIGFSTAFKDEATGFCDTILSNMDILVARSPAHYTSDIQKVRAVFKPELSALKDVIVFSTHKDSTHPLAEELSGGDYDGDIAWVCWQTEIVSEFENAKMPICPDMVKEGYITKNSATYAELVSMNRKDPIDAFLANSFDFNLKQNMLGICTNFKEKLCYTLKSVACDEAVFLSTLLSSLVDQAKQGYSFTNKDWERMKAEKIRVMVTEPNYKLPTLKGNPKDMHLIDHLKFRIAQNTVDNTLADLHKNLPIPQYWDDDVVQLAKFARKEAQASTEWTELLRTLDADIEPIRDLWTKYFSVSREEDSKAVFSTAINDIYPKWCEIKPAMDTPFTRSLTMPYLADAELSTWELLKASILFDSQNRGYVSKMVWWLAGKQLAHLKAQSKGPVSVIPTMYAMLKPDNTFVKLVQVDEHEPRFWEARVEAVVDEDEELDYEE